MKIQYKFILLLLFTFKTYCMQKLKEKMTLTEAVSENNIEYINYLIKEPLKIEHWEFEKAILLAAYNNNHTIFHLLENFVSRKVHRQAYFILKNRTQ